MTERRAVDVAAGVLVRDDGRVLMGSRPQGKPYAGYWEFPGGKFEPGESAGQALERELREELGLSVKESFPWFSRVLDYPHARVRLFFRRCWRWDGEPRPLENQSFGFFAPGELPGQLLPLDGMIAGWIGLPDEARCMRPHPSRGTLCVEMPAPSAGKRFRGGYASSREDLERLAGQGADFALADSASAGESLLCGNPLPVYAPLRCGMSLEQARRLGWHGLWS